MSLGAPNVVNSDVRVYCRVLFDSDKAHVPSCLVRYLDAELTVIVDEQHFARILVAQRGYGKLSRDTALGSLHRDNELLISRPVLDIESLTICIEIYV